MALCPPTTLIDLENNHITLFKVYVFVEFDLCYQ